ncbi:hypothetical protein CIPAW_04G091800 [Carya illinoinensis]|uniref:Secreted protein n=1 Tax=Carya illinoinensis TaxID=32201 RepID=A0A8T1QRA5_CARIL|nr:hypothetical protein CIPAW_04G091800 [Carya illinoinensis]
MVEYLRCLHVLICTCVWVPSLISGGTSLNDKECLVLLGFIFKGTTTVSLVVRTSTPGTCDTRRMSNTTTMGGVMTPSMVWRVLTTSCRIAIIRTITTTIVLRTKIMS